MITNLNNFVNESLGSSLSLPANGLGGSRATSLWVAHFALQNTKFGSEKGKVQKPARIPPQTPPAGGKKAEAGQFHSPRKIVCPAESKLVLRIFVKKSSNFVQKTPPINFEYNSRFFRWILKYPQYTFCNFFPSCVFYFIKNCGFYLGFKGFFCH
jgi:hypothetical protein